MAKDDEGSHEDDAARVVTEIETSAMFGDRMFRIRLCDDTSVTFQLPPGSDRVQVYTSPSYGDGDLDLDELTKVIAQLTTLAGYAAAPCSGVRCPPAPIR